MSDERVGDSGLTRIWLGSTLDTLQCAIGDVAFGDPREALRRLNDIRPPRSHLEYACISHIAFSRFAALVANNGFENAELLGMFGKFGKPARPQDLLINIVETTPNCARPDISDSIKAHIDRHFAERLTVASIAHDLGVSRRLIKSEFARRFGLRVHDADGLIETTGEYYQFVEDVNSCGDLAVSLAAQWCGYTGGQWGEPITYVTYDWSVDGVPWGHDTHYC